MALLSYAPVTLADAPVGSSSLVTAVDWVQDALLGNVATTVAIIAIAAIGFGMLTGRINVRHGLTVVLGCFILFGASGIVSGLRYVATGGDPEPAPLVVDSPPIGSPRPASPPVAQPYDPYAGASVPATR